jgi:lipopolysaccharide heptosyltransferase II
MTRLTVELKPQRILIAQLAFIGDLVFATPLLEALRRCWPAAELGLIATPTALELFDHDPRPWQRFAYDKTRRGSLRQIMQLSDQLKEFRAELFVAVSRSARTQLLARASGAPIRVGFGGPWSRWLLTDVVARDDRAAFPERPLQLLRALGVDLPAGPLELHVSREAREAALSKLQQAGWDRTSRLVAIAPGANYATKRWPIDSYARLVELLVNEFQATVLVFGGPRERELMQRLSALPGVLPRFDIGLRGVVAELTAVDLFVSGDSGPAHIARALGVPYLVLHGPTDPLPLSDTRPYRYLSLGLDCQPCSPRGHQACPLQHHRCLRELSVQSVFDRLRAIAPARTR